MKKLAKDNAYLLFQPEIASKIGLNEAIVLQQIFYWVNVVKNNNSWIYNSYQQWQKQFPFWSQITIRRTIKSLEKKKLILSKIASKGQVNIKYYSINFQEVNEMFNNVFLCPESNRSGDVINLSSSYIDTENTTENNSFFQASANPNINKSSLEKEIIKIWNEVLETSDNYITDLNNHQKNLMQSTFEKHFSSNFEEWKNYCFLIKENDFLSGKKQLFKASIYWALRESNIVKVKSGYYKPICWKNGQFDILNKSEKELNKTNQNTKISLDMIKIWNEYIVTDNEKTIELNSDITAKLERTIHENFDNDILKWEKYCSLISTSKFLMGKSEKTKFKAGLLFAIKAENIQKIQGGYYITGDLKPNTKPLDEKVEKEKIIMLINKLNEHSECKKIRLSILENIGYFSYKSWFHRCDFKLEDRVFCIVPPREIKNIFTDFVSSKYKGFIEKLVISFIEDIKNIFIGDLLIYTKKKEETKIDLSSILYDLMNAGNQFVTC